MNAFFDEPGSLTTIEKGDETLCLADECDHVQWIPTADISNGRAPDCEECQVFSDKPKSWTWRKVYVKA